ncbi:MAG: baseplate J/gp47 family protein [Desulfovibrionaceae bacterium]
MAVPISKTLEEVRTDLYERLDATQADYAAAGNLPQTVNLNKGVLRGLLELWSWALHQLYLYLKFILVQAFPTEAEGEWLDLHVAQVGLTRKAATKAVGTVVFSRSGTSGNIAIPVGRVVRTATDATGSVYRFVTTAAAVLADGQTEVAVPVEAEEYGAAANVTVGAICEISTVIPGVEAVANAADWLSSEGADAETDDQLRERYGLRWQENNGCTKYAYQSWALGVTGVIAVRVLDQHPRGQGTVDVIVKGTAGIPTDALIEAVAAVVADNQPVNDDVEVRGPTAVSVSVEATLRITSGDAAAIVAEAEDRVRALFEDPTTVDGIDPLQVGDDLTLDRLVAAIMAVDGVKEIAWTTPAASVVVGDDGLAVLGSLSLTTEWAGA